MARVAFKWRGVLPQRIGALKRPKPADGARKLGRGWRRALFALALLALGGGVLAFPYLSGRADPPTGQRLQAEGALAAAREASRTRWAPQSLADAVASMRTAQAEERRQQLRFFVLRSYEAARTFFEVARQRAVGATTAAEREHEEARDAAQRALADSRQALSEAERLLADIRLGSAERTHLRRARGRFAEAQVFFDEGDYAEAQFRAGSAERSLDRALAGAGAMAARFVDKNQVSRWRGWIDETIAWSRRRKAAAVVVIKDDRTVKLYDSGQQIRSYDADLGPNVATNKMRAGDKTTPEGRYKIARKKGAGESRYHKALLLDYPNAEDLKRFRELQKKGLVSRKAHPGGLIEIHGNGGRGGDWTLGCVALSDRDIDDLFARVGVGTPVTIVGGNGATGQLTELARHLAAGRSGASP